MTAHRPRRWSNNEPTFCDELCALYKHSTINQLMFSAGTLYTTLTQHYSSIGSIHHVGCHCASSAVKFDDHTAVQSQKTVSA